MITAQLLSGGVWELTASSRWDPGSVVFASEGSVTPIRVAFFSTELSAMGLAEGPIPPYDGQSCAPRAIPGPLSELEIVGASFEQTDTPLISGFRFLDRCPCRSFVSQEIFLGAQARSVAMARTGPDSAVIIYGGETASAEARTFEDGTLGEPYVLSTDEVARSAYYDLDGTLWVGGPKGRLSSGPLKGPLEWVATASPAGALAALAGPTREAPLELYFVTNPEPTIGSKLLRFAEVDGVGRFRFLETPVGPGFGLQRSSVVWLGPNHALASIPDGIQLLETSAGGVAPEAYYRDVVHEALALADSEVFGAMVLSTAAVWARRDDDWEQLASLGLGAVELDDPDTIVPFGDGALVFSVAGAVVQLYPNWTSCPTQKLPLSLRHSAAQGLESGVLIASTLLDAGSFSGRAYWIEAEP